MTTYPEDFLTFLKTEMEQHVAKQLRLGLNVKFCQQTITKPIGISTTIFRYLLAVRPGSSGPNIRAASMQNIECAHKFTEVSMYSKVPFK